MRQMISGLVAAAAVLVAGAAPAAACGWNPCAPVAPVAPVFSGCNTGCGGYGYGYGYGAGYERLAEPTSQYYYVNQGPTYTGPGAFAPTPTYQEDAVVTPGYGYGNGYGYRARPYGYGYGAAAVAPYRHYYRPYRYGYSPRVGYLPRVNYGYGPRYGYAHRAAPYYGRPLRRYY